MLFHEVYGAYFSAVSEILRRAVSGELTPELMKQICDEKAFSESFLKIIPALNSGEWQLLSGLSTPLKKAPTTPLTLLQKRWLKAVSQDPRMKLFGVDWSFLEGIQPLFQPDDIVYFDRYLDGDPFEDPHYISVFRTALEGVKAGSTAEINLREHDIANMGMAEIAERKRQDAPYKVPPAKPGVFRKRRQIPTGRRRLPECRYAQTCRDRGDTSLPGIVLQTGSAGTAENALHGGGAYQLSQYAGARNAPLRTFRAGDCAPRRKQVSAANILFRK